MSILGLPGREGKKERKGMWGHGRSLPPPLPTAAETEGAGEPALEMPSVSQSPWSPRAPPEERTGARSVSPDSNPAAFHRAQCTLPGTGPDRHTCLSMDLNTMYRSRLVRISPALPNVKPCEERQPQGRGRSETWPPMTPQERDLGSVPRQDTEVRKPDFRAWRLCFSNSIPCAWPHHQQSWEDLVLKSTLLLPSQRAGPSRIHRKAVLLSPFPLPLLSLRNQGLTQEAGGFFPRHGEIDSNPGVYIMNHPKREIFESEWGGDGVVGTGHNYTRPEVQPGKTGICSRSSHKRCREQRNQILCFQVKRKAKV